MILGLGNDDIRVRLGSILGLGSQHGFVSRRIGLLE